MPFTKLYSSLAGNSRDSLPILCRGWAVPAAQGRRFFRESAVGTADRVGVAENPRQIVLRGTSGNIRSLRTEALRLGIACVDFTNSMTGGSFEEQLERTLKTSEAELEYYCVVLFGRVEELNPLTKKYSLYK